MSWTTMKEVTIPLSSCPYEIDDQVKFKPAAYAESTASFGGALDVKVIGTVVQIHEAHRWYRAAYETPQGTRHECFKF